MSFDLGVFDADAPPSAEAASQRYMQLCEGVDPSTVRSARVDAFLGECLKRWAPLDDDERVDESPWASWPLESQRTPSGFVASIVWSRAEELNAAWREMADRHGLVLFDPQANEVVLPTRLTGAQSKPRRRGWFRRS